MYLFCFSALQSDESADSYDYGYNDEEEYGDYSDEDEER